MIIPAIATEPWQLEWLEGLNVKHNLTWELGHVVQTCRGDSQDGEEGAGLQKEVENPGKHQEILLNEN